MSYSRIVTRRKTESYEMRKPYRSSHNKCSIVISVLKDFRKFTGKHLCQSLFLIKLQACRSFLQNTSGRILLTLVKSQIWVETKSRVQSFFQKLSFGNSSQKNMQKYLSNLSCPVQFYWISLFRSKYLVRDCRSSHLEVFSWNGTSKLSESSKKKFNKWFVVKT